MSSRKTIFKANGIEINWFSSLETPVLAVSPLTLSLFLDLFCSIFILSFSMHTILQTWKRSTLRKSKERRIGFAFRDSITPSNDRTRDESLRLLRKNFEYAKSFASGKGPCYLKCFLLAAKAPNIEIHFRNRT